MILYSDESENETPAPKKEFVFRNKKEAIEAFKALLKEKVGMLMHVSKLTRCQM